MLRTELRASYMVGMHSAAELHPSRFLIGNKEPHAGEMDEAVKSGVQHCLELTGSVWRCPDRLFRGNKGSQGMMTWEP